MLRLLLGDPLFFSFFGGSLTRNALLYLHVDPGFIVDLTKEEDLLVDESPLDSVVDLTVEDDILSNGHRHNQATKSQR